MIEIIPAIDIINGECIRLSQGDFSKKKVYYKNPVDAAKLYSDFGFKRIHVVDLDGAKGIYPKNLSVVSAIKRQTNLLIQFGGGLKTRRAVEAVFENGADKAICGSIAITNNNEFLSWLDIFGRDRIILGTDIRNEKIAVNGWLDQTEVDIFSLTEKFYRESLRQLICTDITKDGMLCGPSKELYKKLQNRFPLLKITVSGGVSSIGDIVVLNNLGFDSVILGKSLYEKTIKMEDLKIWLQSE